jgi:hypothetical protein
VKETEKSYPDGLVQLDLLFLVLIGIEGVETNVVVNQLFPNLPQPRISSPRAKKKHRQKAHTLLLKLSRSSKVKLSALAMTGTTFTTSLSFFITITSIGRRLCPVGLMKYKQQ